MTKLLSRLVATSDTDHRSFSVVTVGVKEFVANVHHHDDVYIAGELHGNKRAPITLLRVTNSDKSVPLQLSWDKRHDISEYSCSTAQ